jgi:hypothetical protein
MIRSLAPLFAALAICGQSAAAERHLTSADLLEIKRVCRTLPGAPAQARKPWRALRPYTRSRDDVDRVVVVCSAECRGSTPPRRFRRDLFYASQHAFRLARRWT